MGWEKITETTTDSYGNVYETNTVMYDRTDGKGKDYVEQIKKNGVEIKHTTVHPDGKINVTIKH